MKNILPKIYRSLIVFFLLKRSTYLIGMALVRLSRKSRKKYYKTSKQVNMSIVNNAMGKIKMEVDINSYMGGSIYWMGFHHISEILFLKNYLKEDMVFIDIGANQGEFSLFAAHKLTKGKVISFEPVSKQHGYLINNIQLNQFKNIELNNYGLSDERGSFPIYTSSDVELHTGIHEGLSTLYQSDLRNEFEETIELKIFDEEYAGKLTRIDFIKIDIEGAELSALKGMEQHLKRYKPMILIEMNNHTFTAAGYTVNDMSVFLFGLGYKAHAIHRGKLAQETTTFPVLGNYIFN